MPDRHPHLPLGSTRGPRRLRRRSVWLIRAGVIATAVALVAATLGRPHGGDGGTDQGRLTATPAKVEPGTTFKLATFNVLGAVHTDTGQRPGWAPSRKRMKWAVQLIEQNALSVIGFQEFEATQYDRFKQLTGKQFGVYPGVRLGRRATVQNSIAWRRDTWRLVQAHTVRVPYFFGAKIQMPYVLLQNRVTGERVWFYNSHNPADTHGYAWKWRAPGYRIEAALVAKLRAADPSTAVVVTGDKNERQKYFCYIMPISQLHSANGGSYTDGQCHLPTGPLAIDWLMGTSDVRFDNYEAFRSPLEEKTTDHPIVMADATIAPRSTPYVTHAVVLDVQGLPSGALRRAGTQGAPHLSDMIAHGASTLNARTEVERTTRSANTVGMLTGRPVDPAHYGTGVDWTGASGSSVQAAAGHYVPSVYDLVHDYGYRTAFLAHGKGLGIVDRSWGAGDGSADRYGVNNGRDKISVDAMSRTDGKVVSGLVDALAGTTPPAFSFAHLAVPAVAGRLDGWRSPEYATAVHRADHLVGNVQRAIAANPVLADHTLLVVTSDHGGQGKQWTDPTKVADYRVPFLVTGPGVPAGMSLYTLNPQLRDPGRGRPGYSGAQPVRTAFVANLVTSALGMPPVPGSTLDSDQSFTVFGASP